MSCPDANVRAFLKREHELNMAKAYCDQTDFVSRNAEFAEKGTLKVIAATRARQVTAANEEMKSRPPSVPATQALVPGPATRRAETQVSTRNSSPAAERA